MPLQICYSMTINKSQGQSLERFGLYLPNPVFTHGQLYITVSRVTSPSGLKVFIDSKTGGSTNVTKNVVYKEIFYNLPHSTTMDSVPIYVYKYLKNLYMQGRSISNIYIFFKKGYFTCVNILNTPFPQSLKAPPLFKLKDYKFRSPTN